MRLHPTELLPLVIADRPSITETGTALAVAVPVAVTQPRPRDAAARAAREVAHVARLCLCEGGRGGG